MKAFAWTTAQAELAEAEAKVARLRADSLWRNLRRLKRDAKKPKRSYRATLHLPSVKWGNLRRVKGKGVVA